MKRSVSCLGVMLLERCLDIHLQNGSVFCISRSFCSMSSVRDFGVGPVASVTSGCGCKVRSSEE